MKRFIPVLFVVAAFLLSGVAQAKEVVMVSAGKKVKFDYTLTVDGKVADSSKDRGPLEYVQGEHNIIPGLEKELEGMKVGESKTVKVAAKDGYGEVNPEAFKEVNKSELPKEAPLEVGKVLVASDGEGRQMPIVISEVKKDTVVLNFNHPLAGKDLTFDVKIVSIE